VADPADMILPLLREMRSEIGALREHMDARFDLLESAQKSFRHALTADTLMSKLITGEFEERIDTLERRVRELEKSK
jgi:hypothetical protein